VRFKAERSLTKSENIYPSIQGNFAENFIIINTAAKTSYLTRSYPELKLRLQDKKSSS
jgi:hypothetical protein